MAQQVAPPTLPPAAYELAARYQLGPPMAEYQRWFQPRELIGSAALILVGLFFVFGSLFTTSPDGPLGFLIVGLIFIAAGLIWPLIFLLNFSHRVYVCAEGLIQVRGSKADVVRWDQVESFLQAVTRRTTRAYGIPVARFTSHIYTVRRMDGTKLTFKDGLRNVENLGNTIARATAHRLTPRAIAAYNSGAPVAFGNLSISQQGISMGQKLLPWSEYQGYQIKNGAVSIRQQGKKLNWATLPVRRFPNLLVFVALMDYIHSSQGRTAR
jgi:hypothetical protein